MKESYYVRLQGPCRVQAQGLGFWSISTGRRDARTANVYRSPLVLLDVYGPALCGGVSSGFRTAGGFIGRLASFTRLGLSANAEPTKYVRSIVSHHCQRVSSSQMPATRTRTQPTTVRIRTPSRIASLGRLQS